jgi:SAM-dependent methyltransferase
MTHRTAPTTRYIHRRALRAGEGRHDFAQEVVSELVPNYPRWIAALCEPYLGAEVLEVGAGYGTVTQHLVEGRHLVAVDASPECAIALKERFNGRGNVEVHEADLREYQDDRRYDAVVMINTLEHIPDDVAALLTMKQYLRPGGRLVVYVPAHNCLFSDYDRKVGHQRRYDRKMLAAVIDEAGLKPIEVRPVNLLGIPAWFLFSRLLHQDPSDRWAARLWDQTGTVTTRWIEDRVRVPVGLNLLAVAQAA